MSETLNFNRTPQTGKSIKKTSSSSYNPYLRRKSSKSINSLNQSNQDLNQVEHGIVAGSSLFQSNHHQKQQEQEAEEPNQTYQKSLLGKCVGWLFGSHSKSSTKTQSTPSSKHQNQLPSSLPPPPHPSTLAKLSTFSSSNFNNAPLSSSSSSSSSFLQPLPSRLTPSITLPQLSAPQQPWYRSQSPFISQPNGIPTSTSTSSVSFATRRPRLTPHAQLQIFPTDTTSSNHNQNNSNDLNPSSELRMRSVSPYRKSVIRSSALSPVHQRSTSPFRQQTNLFNRPAPRSSNLNDINRTGTSVFTHRQGSVAKDVDFTNRKRFADEMSISPVRNLNPEIGGDPTSFGASDSNGSISKKQMCWDPEVGFMTQEQMNNLKAERERQKRELEGRPFPKNEAERILEALESRRGATSALSEAMRTPNFPQIPVPTPASIATQRSSSIQLLARSKTKNSLAALYEEEELEMLNMSHKKLIAPFNKRIEKDRIKRLEERKGKLREELKKLQKYEEKLNRENISKEVEDQEMQEDRPRRHRSKSTDIANGDNSQLRRSSRKIGKLTSSSTKAKVNSGRRSRDPSVADDENAEHIATTSTRITRSGLRSNSDKNSAGGNVEPSPKKKKTTKTGLNAIKSPSPIPEAEEDQNADNAMATKLLSPELEETNGPTALRSFIRSSSAALQPVVNQRQQRASSSLRPGRTFSSRQSAHKPKVFSAREEDLPSLGDDDEDDMSPSKKEIASLKKIKLPTTFPSSFKLEKFASSKPTPTSAQSDQTQDETQPQTTSQSIFQRIDAPASEKTESASTFSFNKPASNTTNPSPFFSKPVEPTPSATTASATSNEQVGNTSSANFSRIPSGQAPPNFFSNITSSTTEKPAPKPNLFGNPDSPSITSAADAATDKNETGNTPMGVDKEATTAPVAPTSIFGGNTGSLGFNTSNPKSLFGATPAPSTTEPKSLFGTTPTTSTTETKSVFGSAITPAQSETKSLFGGFATSNATTEPKSLFGSTAMTDATTVPKMTFGGSSTVAETDKEPKSLFGTAVTSPSTTTATNQNNPNSSIFGSSNPTPSFTFGAAATPAATTTSSTSLFGNPVSSAPANPMVSGETNSVSNGFSFGGGNAPSVSSQPTNLFGSNNVESAKTNPTSPSLFGGNTQTTNPTGTGFSFNSTNTPVLNAPTSLFGNPSAPVTSSAPTPSFSFGAPTNTTLTPAQPPPVSSSPFSFNSPAPVTTPAATTSTPFTFGGTPSVTTNGNTSSIFGSTGVTATPPVQNTSNGFSFGAASATPIVPPSATPSSSTFTFGASTTTTAPDSIFGKPASTSSNGFTFGSGSVAGGSSSGSLFGTGAKENGTGVMNSFGTGTSTMSSFGNGNGFGAGTGTATPGTTGTGGFTFGVTNNNTPGTPGTPGGTGNVLFSMGVSGGGSNELGGSGRTVKKLPGARNKKR